MLHLDTTSIRTNLFTIEDVINSMTAKAEIKNKETTFLDGMIKAKKDNPRLFKKLEKL